MLSYAQDFEDVLLNRLFRSKPNGFYIDVGACDPVALSATKFFYDLGWNGINIEPVPEAWQRFKWFRRRDTNLNLAAGARHERRLFHQGAQAAFSSFNPELALRPSRKKALKTYKVEVRTLAEICTDYQVGEIDFMLVDVSGAEQEVLEGADFTRWRPRVLVIDAGHLQSEHETPTPPWKQWEPLVLGAGYLFACQGNVNRFYLRREDEEFLPCFAYPAAFQKNIRLAETLPPAFDAIAPGYRIQIRNLRETLNGVQDKLDNLESQATNAALERKVAGLDHDLSEARSQLAAAQNELQESARVQLVQRRMYQMLAHELQRQQQQLSVLRAVHREMLYRSLRRPPLWKRLLGLAPRRNQALDTLKPLEDVAFASIPEMKAVHAEPPRPSAAPPPKPATPVSNRPPSSTASIRKVNAWLEVVEPVSAQADAVHGAWRGLLDAIVSMPDNVRHLAVRVHPLLDLEFAGAETSGTLTPEIPWVGILLAPPLQPAWQRPAYPPAADWKDNPRWSTLGPSCKSLVAGTEDLALALKGTLKVPVHAFCHPLRTDLAPWSMERFRSNPSPALIQIGTNHRCVHAIFMLPHSRYTKILLHPKSDGEFRAWLEMERKALGRQLLPGMPETAEIRPMPRPDVYEDLITSNILFMHRWDTGVDSVLLECIERRIPVLVNRAPAVWEYLGPQYPLYYSCYAEAAEKAADLELVRAAHRYLGELRTEERFSTSAFHKRLAEVLAGIPG